MKVKTITIEYTTGKKEVLKPSKEDIGFMITNDHVRPTAAWSIDDVFKAVGTLLLSTMPNVVDQFGTYKPLFDKLEEVMGLVEKQLSPHQFAKDFAYKFAQGFLYQEVFESSKYPELKKDAEAIMKKAAAKLKDK